MKGFKCAKATVIKSINVALFYVNMFDPIDELIEDFLQSDKGKWLKKHSVGIEKKLTYVSDGDMIINVVALLPEQKLNFFILKWC